MPRLGCFDDTGRCVAIHSGDQDVGDDFIVMEVPEDVTPNTIELDRGKGELKRKERHIPPKPPRTEPTLKERVEALEAQVAALTELLQP